MEKRINLSMSFCTDFGDYTIYDDGKSLGYGTDFKEMLKGVTISEAIERVKKLSFIGKIHEAMEAQEKLIASLEEGNTEFDWSWSGNREIDIWCSEYTKPDVPKTEETVDLHKLIKVLLCSIDEYENTLCNEEYHGLIERNQKEYHPLLGDYLLNGYKTKNQKPNSKEIVEVHDTRDLELIEELEDRVIELENVVIEQDKVIEDLKEELRW